MECKKCGIKFDKKYGKYCSGDYCSRKCANSRQHSRETIDKIRSSVVKNAKVMNPTSETKEKIRLGVLKSIDNRRKSGLLNPKSNKPYKIRSHKEILFICPYCKDEIKTLEYKWNKKTCGKKECVSKCLSDIAKKQIQSGVRINTWGGRCKKLEYISKNNAIIKIDGNFELEFCKWCDRHNISFKRNRIGFKYNFEDSDHLYFPDFSINDDVFIETKGYETEKDRAKWSQFPFPLLILRKKQINLLKKDLVKNVDELKSVL